MDKIKKFLENNLKKGSIYLFLTGIGFRMFKYGGHIYQDDIDALSLTVSDYTFFKRDNNDVFVPRRSYELHSLVIDDKALKVEEGDKGFCVAELNEADAEFLRTIPLDELVDALYRFMDLNRVG